MSMKSAAREQEESTVSAQNGRLPHELVGDTFAPPDWLRKLALAHGPGLELDFSLAMDETLKWAETIRVALEARLADQTTEHTRFDLGLGPLWAAKLICHSCSEVIGRLREPSDPTRSSQNALLNLAFDIGRLTDRLDLYNSELLRLAVARDEYDAGRVKVGSALKKTAEDPDVREVCKRYEAAANGQQYTKETFYSTYEDGAAGDRGFSKDYSRSTLESYLKLGGHTRPRKRRD